MGSDLNPDVANKFRAGDIRHCFADISRIHETLAYEPAMTLERGISELVEWGKKQDAVDRFEVASRELEDKGMLDSGSY